jgi:hypothetical protein
MEQFLYGLFQDGNYVLMKSPGVTQLLSDVNLQYLRQKQWNNAEPFWLPTEQVIAIQYITRVRDVHGRNGIWNHTLLFPVDEYIRATNPYEQFKTHFITSEQDAPSHLKRVSL